MGKKLLYGITGAIAGLIIASQGIRDLSSTISLPQDTRNIEVPYIIKSTEGGVIPFLMDKEYEGIIANMEIDPQIEWNELVAHNYFKIVFQTIETHLYNLYTDYSEAVLSDESLQQEIYEHLYAHFESEMDRVIGEGNAYDYSFPEEKWQYIFSEFPKHAQSIYGRAANDYFFEQIEKSVNGQETTWGFNLAEFYSDIIENADWIAETVDFDLKYESFTGNEYFDGRDIVGVRESLEPYTLEDWAKDNNIDIVAIASMIIGALGGLSIAEVEKRLGKREKRKRSTNVRSLLADERPTDDQALSAEEVEEILRLDEFLNRNEK